MTPQQVGLVIALALISVGAVTVLTAIRIDRTAHPAAPDDTAPLPVRTPCRRHPVVPEHTDAPMSPLDQAETCRAWPSLVSRLLAVDREQRFQQLEAIELAEDDGNPFAWHELPGPARHHSKEN